MQENYERPLSRRISAAAICSGLPINTTTSPASISVSSAAQYLDDHRIPGLAEEVCNAAYAISRDLGLNEKIGFPAAQL